MSNPTPLEATRAALHFFALSTPSISLMAQSCEALRLLSERPQSAEALFDTDVTEAPTDKQAALLKKLGHKGAVRSKRHASELIGKRLEQLQTKGGKR